MPARELPPGVKGYCAWRKALMADDDLRAHAVAARRVSGGGVDIRIVAIAIADHGANGRGCFASAATVAQQIGCSRNTIVGYRTELITAGWLTIVSRNGGHLRRGLVVDISLPMVVNEGEYGKCAEFECNRLVPKHLWDMGQRHCWDHSKLLVNGRWVRANSPVGRG
jgi:hypothetical protein